MSTIGRFLQAKEPLFDHALDQLEERSGRRGVDVVLAAEMAEKTANRMGRLGLDPADTTGRELYGALLALVHEHDEHLARAIGGTESDNVAEMIPLIVKAVEKADLPKRGYFLKHDKAREMLREHPPLAVMERLGYHLISEMLDNEDIYELFLSLRFAEDPAWLNQFNARYQELTPDDFTERDIVLRIFAPEKWGDIAEHFIVKKRHNITHSKEMGTIGVMPITQKRMKGITLKDIPLLVHYFNEIRLYSSFFKLMRTKRNFGEIIARTLIADTPKVKLISNQNIHWRVIQRYFAKVKEPHPEMFEPHVQPEDLHWRRAEEVLYKIDPELEFWRDLDYVGTFIGRDALTFNLMDVSLSYSNELSYDDRYLYHFRESLWNEVFARYMGQKVLEEQLLVKLNSDMIKPELLKLSAAS